MEKNNDIKKNRVIIQFANKQLFNRRKIVSNGKQICLISISLPNTAEHKGFYIDVNEQYVYKSNYSSKMSFTSFKKDSIIPIYKYYKESGKKEKIELPIDTIKAEFDSWKDNNRKASNDDLDNIDV